MIDNIYLDSWVLKAYKTVFGTAEMSEKMRERLGKLSQVHRSGEASMIFLSATNVGLGGLKKLESCMRKLEEDETCYDDVLNSPALQPFVTRKGSLATF